MAANFQDPEVSRGHHSGPRDVRRGERGEGIRLAFSEFLIGAGLWAVSIMLLGGLVYVLDWVRPEVLEPMHDVLATHMFKSSSTTASLLQSISTTVITVASITFSLMVVAIQESASSFTAQVFDQFLRRTANRFFFGFFVGLGAYSLLQTASVYPNPVYGAAFTVLLSAVAVVLLLTLVYTSVNQMRPVVIVEAMHDHLVEARARQLKDVVQRTHRQPQLDAPNRRAVISDQTGFVMRIDLDRIQRAIDAVPTSCEVVLDVSIGTFVAYGDRLARIYTHDEHSVEELEHEVEAAIRRERQRNIDDVDAAYGVEQLETVGWTSISGAKHNPQAARLAVAQLRDVLMRLAVERSGHKDDPDTNIVYHDDFPAILMQALESLAVVTADSQQHQAAADIILAIESVLERLSASYRKRAIDVLMRTLPALASHPPTLALERALEKLRGRLRRMGAYDAADVVDEGLDHLRDRIGTVDTDYTPR